MFLQKGIRSSQEALSATIDGCGTINISYTSLVQNLWLPRVTSIWVLFALQYTFMQAGNELSMNKLRVFALTELFRTNQQRCALTIVRKIVLGSQVWKNYVKSYTLFTPKLHHVSQLFCQTETVFFIKLLKMMFADFKLSTMKIKVHAYLNPNSKF